MKSAKLAPEPIAISPVGTPLLHRALGATFHLEHLAPHHEGALERANDLLVAWFGTALRWSWSSVSTAVEPFVPSFLDLASSYPGQLENVDAVADSGDSAASMAGAASAAMAASAFDRFGVACHGGAERNHASPFSYRFFASTAEPGAGPLFRCNAALSFTVPDTTPPEELRETAMALAAILPYRWGNAGFAYGAWEYDQYGATRDAIYAHARRHPGFDVGQHETYMAEWHDAIRTVSWLTFVGPALVARLRQHRRLLVSDALVSVVPAGAGVVLQAGERPEPGDHNRGDYPRAYGRADELVRPVRAGAGGVGGVGEPDVAGLHFYAPWSQATTVAWLTRFERARHAP